MQWEDARSYLRDGKAIHLDIRSIQEHRERRIPDSLHLNYLELSAASARRILGSPALTVLVYCRNGVHSGPVTDKLRQYGYEAVDMGGVDDYPWQLEGTLV